MLFIFDMGGVVTNTAEPALVEKISGRLGIKAEDFYRLMGSGTSEDLFLELSNGKLSVKEWWRIFSERSLIKVDCDWLRLLFHPVMNEGAKAIVEELKAKGHRVVCGTNTIESHYDNHMSRGDYAIFDMTYASHHMGVSKPDADFWKLILNCENEKAENAFFTDDKIENCQAAQALGIKTYHFDNAQGLRKAVKEWL